MDALREGMEFNGRVWKEPRGFIKILELIFGICAFATTSSFSSMVGIEYGCLNKDGKPQEDVRKFPFEYPFDLTEDERVPINACFHNGTDIPLGGSYASSAEFFVGVGVLAFLYCLGALLIYIFVDKLYRTRDSVAKTDFIVTVIFTFLWLVASSAWAHGVTGVKAATDADGLIARIASYKAPAGEIACSNCKVAHYPTYSNLNISVLFGFLNFFIWGGNVWFLWKETPWFKAAHQGVPLPPQMTGTGAFPERPPNKL